MISIFKKTVKIRKSLGSLLIGIIVLIVSITTTHAQSNELLQSRIRLFEAWLNTLMSDQSLRFEVRNPKSFCVNNLLILNKADRNST